MQQDEGDCTSSFNKQGEYQPLRAVGQEDLFSQKQGTYIRFSKLKPKSSDETALIQLEADQGDDLLQEESKHDSSDEKRGHARIYQT